MKFLKNYTSEAPVSVTISRIETVLIKCGVAGITKEYDADGGVTAMRFHIPVQGREATIRVPAKVKEATDALFMAYADGDKISADGQSVESYPNSKKKRRRDFAEQGARTAWKIVQDWIEVQMSMIQMKQADTSEVFMPYIWDGKSTLYERVRDRGMQFLLPEKAGANG